MIPSHTFRLLFLATTFASMAVVLAWAGWIGWREWPRWRAVREMRAAVEANEPGRFLDAIERVDSLGVAEAAADEIAPLGQHPDPRVRMYAVMARTVLGPRGTKEAKELIELFDDQDEDIDVRCTAAECLALFGEDAKNALFVLKEAAEMATDENDQLGRAAFHALNELGEDVSSQATHRFLGFTTQSSWGDADWEPVPPEYWRAITRIAEMESKETSIRRKLASKLVRNVDFWSIFDRILAAERAMAREGH